MNVKTSGRLGLGFFVLALILSSQPASAVPDFGDWTAPMNLGPVVNSASADEGPAISKDGLSLYFTSNRAGGAGGQDIWVARRADEEAAWEAPVNLGPTVNTPADESAPAFSRDGRHSASDDVQPAISRDRTTLFFASNRSGGSGLLDLYMSTREKGD